MAQTHIRFTAILSGIEAAGRWLISSNMTSYKPFQNWDNVNNFLTRSQSVNRERTKVVLRTLGSKSHTLKKMISVSVEHIAADEVIATFQKAGISICGDSATEAIQLLKTEIAESYEILMNEAKLGPEPQRQLKVLGEYIGKKGRK